MLTEGYDCGYKTDIDSDKRRHKALDGGNLTRSGLCVDFVAKRLWGRVVDRPRWLGWYV